MWEKAKKNQSELMHERSIDARIAHKKEFEERSGMAFGETDLLLCQEFAVCGLLYCLSLETNDYLAVEVSSAN